MRCRALFLGLIIGLLFCVQAYADIPKLINFQGRLTDASGKFVPDGDYSLTFRLYTDSTGGSAKWTEPQTVTISKGLFNVTLGSDISIPDSIFSYTNVWLGIQVGGDPEMSPRQRLSSLGYSYRTAKSDTSSYSMNSDKLDGFDAADFASIGTDYGRSGVATDLYEGITILTNKYVNEVGPETVSSISGAAFTGSASGGSDLAMSGIEGYAENNSTGHAFGGSFSTSSSGTGTHYGVISSGYGSSSSSAYGVTGYASNSSSGNVYGGFFSTSNSGTGTHYGIRAEGFGNTSTSTYGSYGKAENASSGNVYGGYFETTESGTGEVHYGVVGMGYGSSSTYATGTFGGAYSSSLNAAYGVYGFAHHTSSGDAYGGFFKSTPVGTGARYGLRAEGYGNSSALTYGTYGKAENTSSGNVYGGYFETSSSGTGTQHYGVVGLGYGSSSTYTAGTFGGAFSSSSSPAYGFYGYADNTSSGEAYGGRFFSTASGTGDHYGIRAEGLGNGNSTYGCYGYANNSSGGYTYGGYFVADSGGTGVHYGVEIEAHGNSPSELVWGIYSLAVSSSSAQTKGGEFHASSISGQSWGIDTEAWSNTPGNVLGVRGSAYNLGTGQARGGSFWCSEYGTGIHYGVKATSYGQSTSPTYGVFSEAENFSSGNACAGYFAAPASGSGTKLGVYAYAPTSTGYAGYFQGDHLITGTKSAAVKMDNGEYHLLYSMESPENWFEDFGEGQLINGQAHIDLDPLFLQTVTISSQNSMKVFVQLEGDCNGVYVSKGTAGFDVTELKGGVSDVAFSYRVVAKRKGYEGLRLAKMKGPSPEEMVLEQAKHQAEREKERASMEEERIKMEQQRQEMQKEREKTKIESILPVVESHK